jgi:hypothetical protein
LVPITLQNLEGRHQHPMRGIEQFLNLVGAATLDHIDPNERHTSSSSVTTARLVIFALNLYDIRFARVVLLDEGIGCTFVSCSPARARALNT